MNRLIVLLLLCVVFLGAQSVPAGLIYQAAAQGGIDYVSPVSGQAIINQKSALNWHSVAGQLFSDGSIGILTAGLAGVVHLSAPVEIGLGAFHAYYEHSISPLIATGAPNPNDIPPVLAMTGTVSPSASSCVEASMYAARAPTTLSATINGFSVTFASQGPQVLKHIDGSRLKQFQVIDVLVCQPGTLVLPPPSPVSPVPNIKKAVAWLHDSELYSFAPAIQ